MKADGLTKDAKEHYFRPEGFLDYLEDCMMIATKGGDLIKFKPYRWQRVVWNGSIRFTGIKEDLLAGRKVQKISVKSRQVGETSFFQSIAHWFGTGNPNRNCFTALHDYPSTINVARMQDIFYKNSPIQPKVKTWNRTEIHFDSDTHASGGLNSRMFFKTVAKRGGSGVKDKESQLGRSYTIHFFHGSEVAGWEGLCNVERTIAAVRSAMPKGEFAAWTFDLMESPPQGEGYFKTMWAAADPRDRIFLSFISLEEYRAETDHFPLSRLEASEFGDEMLLFPKIKKEIEFWYPELVKASDGAAIDHEVYRCLAFRRQLIRSRETPTKEAFAQHYPISVEDAFMVSGAGVFDQKRLEGRLDEIRDRASGQTLLSPPPQQYRFNPKSYNPDYPDWWKRTFVEESYGELLIFEPPVPATTYVIGADSNIDGGKDRCCAQILRLPDLKQVAVWHKTMDTDEFAEVLFALGSAYNEAIIGVERNGPGLTVLKVLVRVLQYPNVYCSFQNKDGSKVKYGLEMHIWNKTPMVMDLAACIRDSFIELNDEETIIQLKAYRKRLMKREYEFEAATGFHDDAVTSLYIALAMAKQAINLPSKETLPGGNLNPFTPAAWLADDENKRYPHWANA